MPLTCVRTANNFPIATQDFEQVVNALLIQRLISGTRYRLGGVDETCAAQMPALSLRQFLFDACSALGIGEYGSVGLFLMHRTILVFATPHGTGSLPVLAPNGHSRPDARRPLLGGKAENICFRRACRVRLISEGIWFLNISGTVKLGYLLS